MRNNLWLRAAVVAGRVLPLEEAIEEAFAVAESITTTLRSPSMVGQPLTDRERQVADLIARGFTNRQIAAELVFTNATAAKHVEHILNKLAVNSRSQIAVWAANSVPPLTTI